MGIRNQKILIGVFEWNAEFQHQNRNNLQLQKAIICIAQVNAIPNKIEENLKYLEMSVTRENG